MVWQTVRVSLSALRRRVLQATEGGDGFVYPPFPGLRFFRSSGPSAPQKADAAMITLAVVLQGRKHVTFGEEVLTYAPGNFLLITRELQYISRIDEASLEAPYISIALQLPPEDVVEVMLALSDAGLDSNTSTSPPHDAFVAQCKKPILGLLERLLEAIQDPINRTVLAPLILRELLILLLRSPESQTLRKAVAGDDGRIRRAMEFIKTHASKRITVEQMAQHVAMSPSHFAHRFREVVRMSPIQYAKHIRMHQARTLMLRKHMSASETANSVGYASISHFTRDFKDYFGLPPSTYIQQLTAKVISEPQ